MSKYDLSVLVPSIRVQNLEQLHFSFEKSIEPFSWEMIIVSPYDLPETIKNKENVKFYKDLGCPSRCVQIASMLAEGQHLCWFSDDGLAIQGKLAECLQMFEEGKVSNKDAICLRYIEGENAEFPLEYWKPSTHPDQRLTGIKEHFLCAPLGMYNTEYFKELGGLDTRYQHINFCTHDLVFRLQQAGGKVHLSPSTVAKFIWSWHSQESAPVRRAYFENDKDLYGSEWDRDRSDHVKINYFNWMEAESKWKMRFEQ